MARTLYNYTTLLLLDASKHVSDAFRLVCSIDEKDKFYPCSPWMSPYSLSSVTFYDIFQNAFNFISPAATRRRASNRGLLLPFARAANYASLYRATHRSSNFGPYIPMSLCPYLCSYPIPILPDHHTAQIWVSSSFTTIRRSDFQAYSLPIAPNLILLQSAQVSRFIRLALIFIHLNGVRYTPASAPDHWNLDGCVLSSFNLVPSLHSKRHCSPYTAILFALFSIAFTAQLYSYLLFDILICSTIQFKKPSAAL